MNIVIRRALPDEASEYTICHTNCWHAAYKGIIPDEYLNNMLSDLEQKIMQKTPILFKNMQLLTYKAYRTKTICLILL